MSLRPTWRARAPAAYRPDDDKRTLTSDFRALIARAADVRAHVVGHDMGGKAAYRPAHLFPESVEQLVLVDCLLHGMENADALHGGGWHYGFHAAPDIPESTA